MFCDTVSACNKMALLCLWYGECLYKKGRDLLCDKMSACTNMAVLCCVILSVPVPKRQSYVSDTVSVCTNLAALFSVIMWALKQHGSVCYVKLSGPVGMSQCFVVWYCEYFYQCGSVLLCDNVRVCTIVAVICSLILWVPEPKWQCSVVW